MRAIENDFLWKTRVWEEGWGWGRENKGGNNFMVEKYDKQDVSQVTKIHIRWCHTDNTYFRYGVLRVVLYSCSFPPKNPQPQYNHGKSLTQISAKEDSTQYLIIIPQNCQGPQKQRKSINCHSQEEPKEAGHDE